MPTIKLTYFELTFWKAEVPRLCLTLGGLDFEDERIERADWPKFKESKPFQQIPVLVVDGKWLTQGSVITRYTAKLAGLLPEDAFVAAKTDEVMNLLEEFTPKVAATMRIEDEDEKKSAREALAANELNSIYANVVKVYESVGSGKYFLGDKMCVTDLLVWCFVGWLAGRAIDYFPSEEEQLKDYPRLLACIEAVDARPEIQAWKTKHSRHY